MSESSESPPSASVEGEPSPAPVPPVDRSSSRIRLWIALVVAVALATTAALLLLPRRTTRGEALRYVAADAGFVVDVPRLAALSSKARALVDHLRGGPGGDEAVAASAMLARQLGFDLFDADSLRQAGVEPEASLAVGGAPGGALYAVIPVADDSALESTLTRLASDRLGATVPGKTTIDGVSVSTLSRPDHSTPDYAWTRVGGFVIIGAGTTSTADVAAAARRTPERSAATTGALQQARAALGARDVYAYAPRPKGVRSPLVSEVLPDALSAGLSIEAAGLGLRVHAALPPERVRLAQAVLAAGGAERLGELPAALPLYVRGGVDWPAVASTLTSSTGASSALQSLRDAARALGIDLDADVLGNLQPGWALGVGLAPGGDLSAAFDLDPARSNPFSTYTLLARLRVKDAARARTVLDALVPAFPRIGAQVTTRQVGPSTVYTATYAQGEGLSWSLDGDRLTLAGGFGDTLAAALTLPASPLEASLFDGAVRDALFAPAGVAVAVDVRRLATQLESAPASAFGGGPGGMMARSVVTNMVRPLARLQAAVSVAPVADGITVDVAAGVP